MASDPGDKQPEDGPAELDDTRRVRKLTERASDIYNETVIKFETDLKQTWDSVKNELHRSVDSESLDDLRKFQRTLCLVYGEYRLLSRRYTTYLDNTHSEDSISKLNSQIELDKVCAEIVNEILSQTDKSIENLVDSKSVVSKTRSTTSRSSRSSRSATDSKVSCGSLIAQAKAKASAAIVEKEMVAKEKALRHKQIEIEGDLKELEQEKIVQAASAELKVYEQEIGETVFKSNIELPNEDAIPVNEVKYNRTKQYIEDLQNSNVNEEHNPTHLNPGAKEFVPQVTVASELSSFLLKKDLLFSRLTKFDDRPENYPVWKATFQSVVRELDIGVREELDLLVKWLGHDSVKYAVSARASSSFSPTSGVKKLWDRLDERYGAPEIVEASLNKKLESFPKLSVKDPKRLFDLVDILDEIQGHMKNPAYRDLLSYMNTSRGVIPIVNKLPHNLQERWTTKAAKYKFDHNVPFPPFSYFVDFVREISKVRNDPGFMYESSANTGNYSYQRNKTATYKTEVFSAAETADKGNHVPANQESISVQCAFHHVGGHTLNSCRTFQSKPIAVRKKFLRDKNICYKCCLESTHLARDCTMKVVCHRCKGAHATALHMDRDPSMNKTDTKGTVEYGGEHGGEKLAENKHEIHTNCARVCGEGRSGRSCAKIVCVNVYQKGEEQAKRKVYAVIDDQSNRSLVKPEFFDIFGGQFEETSYSLTSCSGTVQASGRRASGFVVENLDGNVRLELPPLTECNQIPDVRAEIPTPEVARAYPHLADLAKEFAEIDDNAPILLLIGRDIAGAHHVLKQRLGPNGCPFAQQLSLGWVIIGEVCLGRVHAPNEVCVNKTYIHEIDRASIFPLCENRFRLKEHQACREQSSDISHEVFARTPDDDKKGMSPEDEEFLELMSKGFTKTDGHWSAPLPFRTPRPRLPNNRAQAWKRAQSLKASLQRDKEKKEHFVEFMSRIFNNGFAELAPPLAPDEECWYLPIFGVYHAKKKGQIRVVFDSSAQYQGLSLNSVLLQGPDLMNRLLGVLMRFRKDSVAIMADVQQMFFQFRVDVKHRNFQRFIWFKDNNVDAEMVEYRMCSHVFGNSSSPSVAAYGLKKTAAEMEPVYGSDVRNFIEKDFYVDDGLASFPTVETAVDVLDRTQKALSEGGSLRLCKIASNCEDVTKAFPKEDLATDLQNISIGSEPLPMQRSLGMTWNLNKDCFTYIVSREEKPLTRRGVLSIVNSLYDPLGFVAPVVIQGKLLLRELMIGNASWDEQLPEDKQKEWLEWRSSLEALEKLSIPRIYLLDSSQLCEKEVHIYCDASEKAISAVAYMRSVDACNVCHVGFILGKSKVAPQSGHTIPRLELCATVLAVEIAETISEHLDIPVKQMKFYSDSRVVLGYLNNKSRRFYIYVQNRVGRVLKSTVREQWCYVPTADNPADQGTRPRPPAMLQESEWLCGPKHLRSPEMPISEEAYELQFPEVDKEIRPDVQCMKTVSSCSQKSITDLFKHVSSWRVLVKVVALLKLKAKLLKAKRENTTTDFDRVEILKESERLILKEVQRDSFARECDTVSTLQKLPKESALRDLNPIKDMDGLLRVGGRLEKADGLSFNDKHPVILPKNHFITKLIAKNFHDKVRHQGYHLTEGAIRAGGFWIIGVKRLVRSIIWECFKCRKLRGKVGSQIMANLPADRLTPGPPFTSVGVDAFGPWDIVTRRTRGGSANNKRWAVLYTCLTTRAIHIEVVEEMSASSFINATRRFIAIRGPVRIFRSDRGTNFVGATDDMNVNAVNVEDGTMRNFMDDNRTTWIFNPPGSSHMGGAWERLIGVVRRILESMLADFRGDLTHEVFSTLMAESCAIVNSRPLVQVSVDPENPVVLSPAMLLTQKPAEECPCSSKVDVKDMYKAQWRRVQGLSDIFWKRWKSEYLQTLQQRRKWTDEKPDLRVGEVVLVKEENSARNNWPMGVITEIFPSEDNHVRKACVKISRPGDGPKVYVRPITKLVTLISD